MEPVRPKEEPSAPNANEASLPSASTSSTSIRSVTTTTTTSSVASTTSSPAVVLTNDPTNQHVSSIVGQSIQQPEPGVHYVAPSPLQPPPIQTEITHPDWLWVEIDSDFEINIPCFIRTDPINGIQSKYFFTKIVEAQVLSLYEELTEECNAMGKMTSCVPTIQEGEIFFS
jgi:hypothetical protein